MNLTEAGPTKKPSKEFMAIMEKLQSEYPDDLKAFLRGHVGDRRHMRLPWYVNRT